MKRCWNLLLVWAAAVLAVQGQVPSAISEPAAWEGSGMEAPLSVGYQKTIQLPIAGATAAYSLDANVVEASAAADVVAISGKSPGSTSVVVVTAGYIQTISVTVPVPPPTLPPGFDPPEHQNAAETGIYEFRYNSDPGQITNSLELKRTQGQSFTRMQIVNANLFSSNSSTSAVGFPFLAYEIGRPNTDVTFLDKDVANSPLTLDNYLVRGFHLRQGVWEFHGGFTSVATFQNLFLATDREYTAGVSRLFRLDNANSLEANAYYFQNPASQRLIATNGAVGSLVYRLQAKDKGNFLAELGVSRGVGFAARGNYDDQRTHVTGDFRIQSRDFASLAVNNQHGTFADLNASRKINERLYTSLDLNQSSFNLPTLRQSSFTTSGMLNYKLDRHFSVNGGGSFATFQSQIPLGSRVSTINLPVGIDYSTRHFGAGFQYGRTINIDGGGGNDYAVNVRGSAGNFQLTGFFRHDVQVPTLAAIFSQIPGLQDALDRAGIVATSPEQLADLLRNTALLQLLGFTNAFAVNLAPARNDSSATLTWMPPSQSRRKVDVSVFHSNTELLQGSNFILTTATVSYGQRLGTNTNIVGSASLVRTTNLAVTGTHPLFSISLQRKFYSVPTLLLPGRHGMIEGHVFRDDDSAGMYNPQMPVLAGVEVRLDDEHVTHTDAGGYYSFHHVPFGVHRVEAHLQSDEPFFYTTDSPATTDMNASVDFGVNFAKGQIFGYLLDDARSGVGGITVELKNEKFTRRATTAGNGKFAFTGLPPGDYTVATLPDSYPPGYALQDLSTLPVTVEPGKPASAEFTVRAMRSIAGRVLVYDKGLLQTVPLEGATVRLKEPALEVKTGANGTYIFRNLAAGTYTVAVEYGGRETTRSIVLTAAPANIRDVDLTAGAREASAPKNLSLLDNNTDIALSVPRAPQDTVALPQGTGPLAGNEMGDLCFPAYETGHSTGAKIIVPLASDHAAVPRTQLRQDVKAHVKTGRSAVAGLKAHTKSRSTVTGTKVLSTGNNPTGAKAAAPRTAQYSARVKVNRPHQAATAGLARANSHQQIGSAVSAGSHQTAKPALIAVRKASLAKHLTVAEVQKRQPNKIKVSSAVSRVRASLQVAAQSAGSTLPPSPAAHSVHCLSDPLHWQQ